MTARADLNVEKGKQGFQTTVKDASTAAFPTATTAASGRGYHEQAEWASTEGRAELRKTLEELHALNEDRSADWPSVEAVRGRLRAVAIRVGIQPGGAEILEDELRNSDMVKSEMGKFQGPNAAQNAETRAAQRVEEYTRQAADARACAGCVARYGIGNDPKPIAVAEARRVLAEGQRHAVMFLSGRPGFRVERTVKSQKDHRMTAVNDDGGESFMDWAGTRAEMDTNGNILISDSYGAPMVAYQPIN